jgi:murein DD-endopeptidase MepM/ murein hydrolase activator NlpD
VRLWPALATGVFILTAGSTPSIAQSVPRFLFPVMGAAGGALIVVSLVNSLVGLVRRYRDDRRVRVTPIVANAVRAVCFVMMPLVHLACAVTAPQAGAVRILAGFGDWWGSEGYPRFSRHRGIDVAGRVGADVLAAAPGRVVVACDTGDLCGLIVAIVHAQDHRTVYCHFSEIAVRVGDSVERGQRIGAIGTSGQRAWPGFEHVHLELQRGRDINDLEDPLAKIVGCFDPTRHYATDRLLLTYPVRC